MLNLLFYHANTIYFQGLTNSLFLSIVSIYFKTFVEVNKPEIASKINWHRPIQRQIDDDALVNYCNDNKIHLLCLSVYLWNQQYVHDQIIRIKPRLHPDCKIMIGGPSVDVNINQNFFVQNSFADYAIYGPGEIAFADLVEHIINNKKLIAFNVSNLAWYDKSKEKQVVADYKNVSQSQISPFLYNKDFFKDIVEYEIKNNNYRIILPYELTRGCPYACTFCDWNSGLSNKVSRRKNTYQEEIDLFQELNISNLYFADANFGQYDEDIKIVEYLAKKNIEENANFKTDGNLSKLKKDANLKIYHLFAQGDLVGRDWAFTFSVQDINEDVLKNIERPDVGWEVHKRMIMELHEHYPDYNSKVQFIVGLPGQTLETIKKSLTEIICCPNTVLCAFISELLPASPAARDTEYQKKFQFTYSRAERVDEGGNKFRGTFPRRCVSFDEKEFCKMMVLTSFITSYGVIKERIRWRDFDQSENAKKIIQIFLESDYFEILSNNLYYNWIEADKFYYTINFDGKEQIVPGCNPGITGNNWADSIGFQKLLIGADLKDVGKNALYKKLKSLENWEGWFPNR